MTNIVIFDNLSYQELSSLAYRLLIERFGDIVLQDLDSDHRDALAVANAFNEDARLESIIYLLNNHQA